MGQLDAGTDLLLVPSYSADPRTLACIDGLDSWAERHLVELRHLLHPGNRLVLVTPTPISECCIEAVLKLIPAVPPSWLRERLEALCLHDRAPQPLTHKLLARPRLLKQLREQLRPGARLACYAVSPAEMALAELLNLELEGTPAGLAELGSKAGAAEVFTQLGFPHPRSTMLCHSLEQLRDTSAELLERHGDINALVVKLNRMAGGRGNAPLALELQPWRSRRAHERLRQHRPSAAQCREMVAEQFPHRHQLLRVGVACWKAATPEALPVGPSQALLMSGHDPGGSIAINPELHAG